jgi:anion-transporting  ArsA/GET3 family ATPase
MGHWEGVRLHVVTGKGGTGKTTVASALALALATGGRRVLVAEVEGRQGLAQHFDVQPLTYAERHIATAPGGGDVYGLSIDPREAMNEYFAMYYKLGRAGRALDRLGFVDFATTIAPGLRDVLLTGKLYEATRRRDESRQLSYDAVVVDAPPTGRITQFLDVSSAVTSLARVGPINRQARSIIDLVHSPHTAVHLVTILEEMPVQETLDAVNELRASSIPIGALIVNQVRSPHLRVRDLSPARRGDLDADEIGAGLRAAGLPESTQVIARLTADASYHAERTLAEKRRRATLMKLGQPAYDVPRVPEGIDPTALYEIARTLAEQGVS